MSSITKEQWTEIQEALSSLFVSVKFKYQDYELSVIRVRESESKTVLQVYIDGQIKGAWFLGKKDDKESDAPTILNEVYKERSVASYKPALIKDIEKTFGKRKAIKHFPDLHKKTSYLVPYFSTASALCRQYKKLKGLTLLSM
ncbi:hypothetical protein [Aliivibrio finisterrensis]|nr:hypothetical protein [Aliivibrio finisterrensis]